MKIKIFLLLLFLFFCYLACNNPKGEKTDNGSLLEPERIENVKTEIEFDETKWKTKKGRDYPYRNSMLNDLIYNDKFRELKKDELLDLLGEPEPDRNNENYLYYMIAQKRIISWPLHTKTLVIKLNQDSTINWMKIHE